ncbi:MAG: IS30 family transposase [Eubacteriales bacterium]
MKKESNNHLTVSERFIIERGLYQNKSFKEIALEVDRHPTTISREIVANRTVVQRYISKHNTCTKAGSCLIRGLCDEEYCSSCCTFCRKQNCNHICSEFTSVDCEKLLKSPYVCNACTKRVKCRKTHIYYRAQSADANYRKTLSKSRQGIRASCDELHKLNDLITPLIKQGQSLAHIFSTHSNEIQFSRRTIYHYVDSNVLSARNIDLPRKVRYKKRRRPKTINHFEYEYRKGRTYADFLIFMEKNPGTNVVEMDTVKGGRNKGKTLLTMIFNNCSFMLVFLIPDGKKQSVIKVFDHLTNVLGFKGFRETFPVILTDNGGEFKDVLALEYTKNNYPRTKVFYCDPMASWQKPHIEKNHEFIRYVIPKGKSFDEFNQEDITLLTNHINSFARDSLGGKTPFSLAENLIDERLLNALDLTSIPPNAVFLKPKLLKD